MHWSERISEEQVKQIEECWLKELKNIEGCIEEEVPECSVRCPFHLNVREMLERLKKGYINSAYRQFYKAVAFPVIVANCCDAPCREHCVMRNKGGALDIPRIERALLKYAVNTKPSRYNMPGRDEKIAVIGAGMSGLGCALRLLNRKYQVSVFDILTVPGGCVRMLMDSELVDREIRVQFENENCDWHLGECINDPLKLLKEGYHAVYIATGLGGDDFGLLTDNRIGLCASKTAGIYLGGRLTGATPMEALAQGFRAAGLIDGYLKTGIMRVLESEDKSHVNIPEEFLEEKLAITPTDNGEFTKEEAVLEAERCASCKCDTCMRGCPLMRYYEKGPKRINTDIYVSVRPETLDGNGTVATRLIGSCHHCGYCRNVCPSGIDLDSLIMMSHSLMTANETMPWAWHEYWLRDMAFSRKEAGITIIDRVNGNPFLFFPGCQTGGSDPRYVTEPFRLLKELEPQTGLYLTCCGAPALWASALEIHKDSITEIRNVWKAAGKPVFILSCPSCIKMFKQFLPEIKTVSLYEFLAEHDVIPKRLSTGEIVEIFDPCVSEGNNLLRESVRKLVEAGKYNYVERKRDIVCCSYGGQVDIANPHYSDWLAQKQAFSSENTYITYCVNCRDTFASKGKRTFHILDLLFDLNDSNRCPPGVNARRTARLELKKYLEGKMDCPGDKAFDCRYFEMTNDAFFKPDSQLIEKLDRERILWEDVCNIVLEIEKTGDKIMDNVSGDYFGHRMIGHMTYWVRYVVKDGKYRVINAYAHRMKIDG